MQQMVKKPQLVTIHQYMACMGVLNDYLAFLPTVYNSSMVIEGTKKKNVPFNEADLVGIILILVPVSWMNQYNMTHLTLPESPRALVQDLEAIKCIMNEKHKTGLKAKEKEASTSMIDRGSSKKRSASGNPGERVRKNGKPTKFCQHCKNNGGPHLTHNTKECCRYDKDSNSITTSAHKPNEVKKPFKNEGNN
jgi:hypothetical protein